MGHGKHASIPMLVLNFPLSPRVLAITEGRQQCGADTMEHLEMNLLEQSNSSCPEPGIKNFVMLLFLR